MDDPVRISWMLAPRIRLRLLSVVLLASCLMLSSCGKARDEGKGERADQASSGPASADREGADARPNHLKSATQTSVHQDSAPSESEMDQKKRGQASPSESTNGPSYLVVLASWKLGSEETARPAPVSVQMADGFPRPANAQESTALRPGYGALLAGVCSDSVTAARALEALRAEDFDAYLKKTELQLQAKCPLPSRKWRLDHQLLLAAESEKPDALARAAALLDQGASPHGIGARSPLELAAYHNDVSMARLLLERGARPNRPHRAAQQESALELALRTPHGDPVEMVELLVKHGADVNAQTEGAEADPGSTVQLVAIRGCYPRILTYLREKGAKRHPVSADEVCRDRLPSEAVKSELSAILGTRSKE